MNITFKTKKLERTFNSERELIKEYGKVRGCAIKRRMMVLKAAPTLADVSHLPPERRHELSGSRKNEFAVDLISNYRLVFIPNHNPLPYDDDKGIILTKVDSIKILGVIDYH